MNVLRQNLLMGYTPAAGFAKFDRSKPHLNVGTIGKSLSTWIVVDGYGFFFSPSFIN
jgi:hypothetical protein